MTFWIGEQEATTLALLAKRSSHSTGAEIRRAVAAHITMAAEALDDERPRAGGQARASSLPGHVEAEHAPG